jgi:L-ribulose-5-phosphate 4-epimerase
MSTAPHAHDTLRAQVWQANLDLVGAGLVILTWGNASGVDRHRGTMLIKPSGVAYGQLRPEDLVTVALDDGRKVDGDLNPSSDTPTHRALYRAFPCLGGIVHTHSPGAVAWAQAGRAIPCLGTTHADHFAGPVPVTRQLTPGEIATNYEENLGAVIVECFRQGDIDPDTVPAVLVPGHGPFTWGKDAAAAVRHAVILEAVADMARRTLALNPSAAIPEELSRKHFRRKHGPDAYYGQR